MKIAKIVNVLLLLSLLTFLPLTRPPVTLNLVPFQTQHVVINLHGQSFVVESETSQPIGLNVSYMNSNTNQLEPVVDTFFIESFEFELPMDKQGNFLFEFSSTTITEVSITSRGVPLPNLGIVGVFLALRFLITLKNTYTVSLDY